MKRSSVVMPDVAGSSAVDAWRSVPLAGELSRDDAQRLTDDIRNHVTAAWMLLIRAHEGKAWRALGYATWADYVGAEFDMSRRRSYQILDQGRVILAIEEAVCTDVHIPEAETRDIKPVLPAVVANITERITPESTDEEKREVVREEIAADWLEGRAA